MEEENIKYYGINYEGGKPSSKYITDAVFYSNLIIGINKNRSWETYDKSIEKSLNEIFYYILDEIIPRKLSLVLHISVWEKFESCCL